MNLDSARWYATFFVHNFYADSETQTYSSNGMRACVCACLVRVIASSDCDSDMQLQLQDTLCHSNANNANIATKCSNQRRKMLPGVNGTTTKTAKATVATTTAIFTKAIRQTVKRDNVYACLKFIFMTS